MAAARILMIGSSSSLHHQSPMKVDPTKTLPRTRRLLLSRASNPKPEEEEENNNDAFFSQKDLNYLLKLGAGTVGGAAVIKYGSVLFPEITKPNIVQALIMISTPMLVAVLLLIKQSRVEGQSKDPF